MNPGSMRPPCESHFEGCSIIVLDVPLLFEDKMDKWTKPIVVIWFDPETQLQRLMTRDGSMEEAKSRINAQMSLDLKRSKADIVIDNISSLEALHEQFQKVLTEITKPLTCIEFMLSRNGAFLALFSTFVSVAVFKKVHEGFEHTECISPWQKTH
ncbi:hypothetical protein P3S67_012827 [Capsicum chacoense]